MAEVKHGLRLKLYNFNKRRNSTKQPNEVWFYNDPDGDLYISAMVVFKAPTDLLQPTILLAVDRENKDPNTGSGEFDSYWLQNCNYAALDDRYYWIEKIISVRRDHWEVTLTSDPLATFKNWIGETKVFAEYTGNNNIELIDSRLPRRTNGSSSGEAFATPLWNAGEIYIVGVISENGFDYYKMNYNEYSNLMKNIQTTLDLLWDTAIKNLPDSPKIPGIGADDKLGEVIKNQMTGFVNISVYLAQSLKWSLNVVYEWVKSGMSKESALSFITDVWYYPMRVLEDGVGSAQEVTLGNLKTGITANKLNGIQAYSTVNLSVPASMAPPDPAWLGRNEFCHWNLYVPYFGNIEIPADLIRGGSSVITIDGNVNVASGMASIRVGIKGFAGANTSITLAQSNSQIGGKVNFGAGSINTQGAAVSAIGTVAGIASTFVPAGKGLTEGGKVLKAAVGLAYAGQNAMNFTSAVTPVGSCVSGSGAGVLLHESRPEGKITLTRYNFGVSATPNSLKDTIGMPTFDTRTVKNCGGYVKATGASFSAKRATAQEIDTINLALNSGLYYE